MPSLMVVIAVGLLPPCVGLLPPVAGPVVEPFAPIGRYAGHWGIDFATAGGTAVQAADAGVVSFVGVVVGNRTVTIDHGGLKTSYSFLSTIATQRGARVGRGALIGRSGFHRGRDAVHFSTRIDGEYVDPVSLLGCRRVPGPGLWLRSLAYPSDHAGHHGRHLRSTARGASRRRRSFVSPTRG